MADKQRIASSMTARQKAIIGVFVLLVLGVAWQVKGMLGSSSSSAPVMSANKMTANMPQPKPKQVEVQAPQPMSEREAALIVLQKDTQEKYIRALDELQLLKVERDIATTNKDISKAQLDRVSSEKKIVDMLTAPSESAQSKNLVAPSVSLLEEVTYSVVSVSQLQYRWNAVMRYKGSLFSVHTGDILPPDGSKVVSIQKDGVTLQKDGETKKLSLVSGF